MTAREALEKIKSGCRVHSEYDSYDIFYVGYANDRIGRLRSEGRCCAHIVHMWNPEDFFRDHLNISFELYKEE